MIWFFATLAPSIAIRCLTIRAEQDAGRRLHLLWSVLLHGEAPVKDMPPRSFYLHSVTLGHCLLEGVPCILADIRGTRWQVYPSLRVAAIVHALCSVLWALLHLHTFTPARALVPSHSFSVAFSKTTCLRLSRLLVFAACTFRLRRVANNHAFWSFFPTLIPNILIELPLGRILPIWA